MASNIHQRLRGGLSAEARRQHLERLNRLADRGPLHYLRAAAEGFNNHNDFLWASGLTYTTSLSLVPILAVALSTLKGLGGVERVKPIIESLLAVNQPQIANQLMTFVGNINARTLGAVGGATLLVTVVLTLSTIENALNTIFSVAQGRSWMRMFTDYLSLVFTVPLLIVAAVPLKSNLQAMMPHLLILGWIAAVLPLWAGFAFLYVFFPNRRVLWSRAAVGGLAAAILLEVGQWGYVTFQVGVARYQAIYGAIAAVPILLTWIYIAWIIVLVGAEITAALQGTEISLNVDYRSLKFMRAAALLIVARAGEQMTGQRTRSCTVQGVAAELGAPEAAVRKVLERLVAAGLAHEMSTEPSTHDPQIFLSRDLNALTLNQVLDALDEAPSGLTGDSAITNVLQSLHQAQTQTMAALTVHDLIELDAPEAGSTRTHERAHRSN